MKLSKKNIFIAVYVVIIVFFIVIVELSLRITGFGIDNDFIEKLYNDEYLINTKYSELYYPSRFNINAEYNYTDKVDLNNDKIIFVIGGSTVEGFPYFKDNSFSEYIEEYLEKYDKSFNVVNLGFSALDSYYVKDTVKNVLKYNPFAIVIYTGHNEIYGTLGYGFNNGNSIKSDLYLFLKQFYIFQNLLSIKNKLFRKINNKTLMERQFNYITVKKDSNADKDTIKNYYKNINSIKKRCSTKNIPLIIYKPVSNVIDMPPFKDSNEGEKEYKKYIENKEEPKDLGKYKSLYLKYIIEKNNENISYDKMNEIKNNDFIPFRARDNLVYKLQDFETNTIIIDLEKYAGSKKNILLGNYLFIDHLHFNKIGNRILGFLGSSEIIKLYDENINIDYNLNDNNTYYDIYSEINSIIKINNILNNSIYNNMLIKYKNNKLNKKTNYYKNNYNELYNIINDSKSTIALDEVVDYLVNNKNIDEALNILLKAYKFNRRNYNITLFISKLYRKKDLIAESNIFYYLSILLMPEKDKKEYLKKINKQEIDILNIIEKVNYEKLL